MSILWLLLVLPAFPALPAQLAYPAQRSVPFQPDRALDCSPRDFRAALGPPRDQTNTAWCYAHSAAELVTQRLGRRVSAFDLAEAYLFADPARFEASRDPKIKNYLREHPDLLTSLRQRWADPPENYHPENILGENGLFAIGGMDDEAILLANLRGFCADSRLPDSGPLYAAYMRELERRYSARLDRFEAEACHTAGQAGPSDSAQRLPRAHSQPLSQAETIARLGAGIFQHFVRARCEPRFRPNSPLVPHNLSVAGSVEELETSIYTGRLERGEVRAKLLAEIYKNLDSGRAVSIGFNLRDLNRPEDVSLHADHSGVIAARKRIGGVCHYFVRTHFGADCDYRANFTNRCEARHGGVWVRPEELPSLYSVVSIP